MMALHHTRVTHGLGGSHRCHLSPSRFHLYQTIPLVSPGQPSRRAIVICECATHWKASWMQAPSMPPCRSVARGSIRSIWLVRCAPMSAGKPAPAKTMNLVRLDARLLGVPLASTRPLRFATLRSRAALLGRGRRVRQWYPSLQEKHRSKAILSRRLSTNESIKEMNIFSSWLWLRDWASCENPTAFTPMIGRDVSRGRSCIGRSDCGRWSEMKA